MGQYGGTCGNVCSLCTPGSTCQTPGAKTFNLGAWNGTGNCGADANGPIICNTIMWTCIK